MRYPSEVVFLKMFQSLDLDTSSAINLKASASNELRLITRQEQTVIRHILRFRQSAQRDVEEELLYVVFRIWNSHKGLEPVICQLSSNSHGNMILTARYCIAKDKQS